MTIDEMHGKLDAIIKGFPASGYESVADSIIADLNALAGEADGLGMKSGKEVIINLAESLKIRKAGGNTDDSVLVRLTALDFYVSTLKTAAPGDL